MKNELTIEIIVATYNGASYLKEQIESLLCQTVPVTSIMICDDGSVDETVQIIDEYAAKVNNISVRKNPRNLGYTMNFLCAVRRSKADYVMLCDQDDIWKEDKVEKTLSKMREMEEKYADEPVLVFGDAEIYNGRTSENRRFFESQHLDTKKVDIGHILMENKCIGCTIMVNRALTGYLEHLPLDIRVHDWWLAMIASGLGRIGYVDEALLLYRQHEENQIGGKSFSGYVKNRLKKIREQKETLRATYRQGEVFYRIFEAEFSPETKKTVYAFATMGHVSWIRRRARMIRYGFFKSGLMRNAGLFLLG